ncbi:leucine-rich repeat neuronal protein 1-like [Ptychodera flava]|uniref:leucine-rich repeat neuronal protein 1-like n=1 Tax=Ptychodera flava TaxID=63121 RepID=UPI00396A4E08
MGLSYISDGAFRGMTLANHITIDLSRNQLSFLSDSLIFDILSSDGEQLIDLRFHGNPWACDCRLRGLRQLIENYRVPETTDDPPWRFRGLRESIKDYGEGIFISSLGFICRTPQIYAGFNVMDISPETLICTVPEFDERVEVTSVDEGDTSELNCTATGVPEPSVYWITPGGNLVNGTNYNDTMGVYEELQMNSQGTLFITSSRTEHSGTYVCIATNMKGTATKFILLRVKSWMTSSIADITKPVDESSTISTNTVEGRRFQHTDTNLPKHLAGLATGAFVGGFIFGAGVVMLVLVAAIKRNRMGANKCQDQNLKIKLRFSDLQAVVKSRKDTEESHKTTSKNVTDLKNVDHDATKLEKNTR